MFFSVFNVRAQDIEDNYSVRSDIGYLFENLNKSTVPTGMLKEYATELVDLFEYPGQITDSNSVSFTTYEYILRTLKSSIVRSSAAPIISNITDEIGEMLEETSSVPVGVVAFKYNYIDELAIQKGLLSIENEQVYDMFDNSGNWVNPYKEAYVLAFSPINPVFEGCSATLDFSSYLHTNLSIASMAIDYGNGYVPVSGNINVDIGAGCQQLKLKVTLTDGTILNAHTHVYGEPVTLHSQETPPDKSLFFEYDGNYQGYSPKARVDIKYASGHSSLIKPFIVVEGFDPDEFADLMGGHKSGYGILNWKSFCDRESHSSIVNEYDIVYVDWAHSDAYIQANAGLLVDVIDWVNENKIGNEKNVVYAHSMGGLIARYALCQMESSNNEHNVSMYISHDCPHLGANVPLGILYAANDILNMAGPFFTNVSKELSVISKYINAPSVKQMLINCVSASGDLDNSIGTAWQEELRLMGFPKGDDVLSPIRNIAISNGGSFSPVSILAQVNGNLSLDLLSFWILLYESLVFESKLPLASYLLGAANINADIQLYPFGYSQCLVYEMNLTMKKNIMFLGINKTYSLYSVKKYAPIGVGLDAVSGSYFSLESLMDGEISEDDTYIEYEGEMNALWGLAYGNYTAKLADKFLFIPMVSSLCVGGGNQPLMSNDYNAIYTNADNTPFNDVFITEESEFHCMSLSSQMCSWIKDNNSLHLEGPVCAVNGTRYQVHNANETIRWTTSDNNIATISSSGVLTVNSTGFVTVYADIQKDGYTCHLEKRIMTGLPDFVMTSTKRIPLGGHRVEIECEEVELHDFWIEGGFSYYWGEKVGNGIISWTRYDTPIFKDLDNNRLYVSTMINTERSAKYVYFKVENEVYNVTYSTYCSMVPIPEITLPILVNPEGNLVVTENGDDQEVVVKNTTDGLVYVKYLHKGEIVAVFDYYPSVSELCGELLKCDAFRKSLFEVRPWGTEEFVLFEMQVFIKDSSGEINEIGQVLKFVYNE